MLQRVVSLKSYQGTPCLGLCKLSIHSTKGEVPAMFAIVPDQFQSILGLTTAMDMGIIDIPESDKFTRHELMVGSVHSEGNPSEGNLVDVGQTYSDKTVHHSAENTRTRVAVVEFMART